MAGYQPLGKFPPFHQSEGKISFSQIRGGIINAEEIVLAGGTTGRIRSENYDPTNETGWGIFGDGSASFYGDVFFGENAIFQGDLYSANWDGTVPVDLSAIDEGATQGFAFDSSEGNVQIQSLFAAEIALLDVQNDNTQVGAISGSNDELLISSVTAKNLRLASLTGGEIQIDPGLGGKTVLNSDTEVNGTLTFIEEDVLADVDTLPTMYAVKNNFVDWSLILAGPDDNSIGASAPASIELWGAQGASNGIKFYSENRFAFQGGADLIVGSSTGDALLWPGGDSSAPTYSFLGDPDTGIYRRGTNQLGFATAGVPAFWIHTSGNLFAEASGGACILGASTPSASLPAYTFGNDTDTGIYRVGANVLGVSTGGNLRLQVGTAVTIAIPSTTGSGTALVVGGSDANGNYAILRSSSARKYKSHIDYSLDLASLKLKPAKFYREDDDAWYYGFVADDLAEEDPLLGIYDSETGEVENYDQRAVMAVMAAKINQLEAAVLEIQENRRRIEQLEQEVARLKGEKEKHA